jgi:heterodisulfide reductase subunit C
MQSAVQVTQQGSPAFARHVERLSGEQLCRCYQCLTCTLGCPVVSEMDYEPHQLVRMVQTGMEREALSSRTIWLCASCESCATRCPNGIQLVKVMDALRQTALARGVPAGEQSVVTFHRTFLEGVRRYGRQYELGMMLRLKLRTRDLFSDLCIGVRMLARGKLHLMPPRGGVAADVRALFERAKGGKG